MTSVHLLSQLIKSFCQGHEILFLGFFGFPLPLPSACLGPRVGGLSIQASSLSVEYGTHSGSMGWFVSNKSST
jgi:hypothetical protein